MRPKNVIGDFSEGMGYKPEKVKPRKSRGKIPDYRYTQIMLENLIRANKVQRPFGRM